jgi:hypothetical protein
MTPSTYRRLRRLQRALESPRRTDHDVRILARLQVALLLAREEGRRLERAVRKENTSG